MMVDDEMKQDENYIVLPPQDVLDGVTHLYFGRQGSSAQLSRATGSQ